MFKYKWQYRPGRINVADPLSRVHAVKIAAITRRQALFSPVADSSVELVPDTPAADSLVEPASATNPHTDQTSSRIMHDTSMPDPAAATQASLTPFQQ